ncbi:hypothetical protein [Aurantimonas sp. HBX-1]|nr:hypothetical protein [Aurantimonas sp. HBX-1]UIJ74293.1 hypothetical protein LXB15_11120 [Aurantimonas sp. HBX-1]
MNGPALALPLKPLQLTSAALKLRQRQISPLGAMVTCCAMSLQPLFCI